MTKNMKQSRKAELKQEENKDNIIEFLYMLLTLIVFFCFIYFIHNLLTFNYNPSHHFCQSKGYDNVYPGGSYSESFGKVKCFSCYLDECKIAEFNVTTNHRGKLIEND